MNENKALARAEIEAAIAYFEDAVREIGEIISECSPNLQAELEEQNQHFAVAPEALERLSRVEAERDAASNTKLELFFGRGELGIDTVAENEDSPLREILIRRLQSPVIPIGSTLGDKGKTVDELENILVRMHFENVESALVLERALQIVLGSFVEPRRGAQGEG